LQPRLLSFIAHKHIFLGAALGGYTLSGYSILNIEPNRYYALFVFAGTLCLYNLHRWLGMRQKSFAPEDSRYTDAREDQRWLLGTILFSGIVAAVTLVLFLPLSYMNWVLPAALLSAMYSLKWLPGGKRLKDLPGAKVPLVVLVIIYLTTALPYLAEYGETTNKFWWLCGARVLFMTALTLPFDIRDLDSDRRSGIITPASFLGIQHTLNLSLVFMLFFGFSAFWLHIGNGQFIMAQILLALAGGWVIHQQPHWGHSNFYYAFGLEGLIMAEALLFYALL
jgi:4-hydroxybenzoate polyprenyltransferase